jgi:hypothetical protein
MIHLEEQTNGDLKIILADSESFNELLDKDLDERVVLTEMLDDARLLGNDWHAPTDLGLTEVPAIGYGHSEDEGGVVDYEKLWIFNDYMVTSFLEELKINGYVKFKKIIW